ncbi:N-acetylmuramoyl-L-alanine amidase [Cellulomonas sp. NS3]|uniref:N-acetylmuramoyl-L-alanine amidase n=1 Tax=Cellulomonas sp. NS3 TaxID=2973977 RepID=UPI00216337E2|nr:N-acetylmuramoyl-L-alanine amidase [Cellulomonas sp. NS3]
MHTRLPRAVRPARRRAALVAATVLLIGTAVPTGPAAADEIVSDPLTVEEHDLSGVDEPTLDALPEEAPLPTEEFPPTAAGEAQTEETQTPDVLSEEIVGTPFSVAGVSWDRDPAVEDVVIRYRVRVDDAWSAWEAVGASDIQADTGSADVEDGVRRDATDAIVAPDADGIQVWADAADGEVSGLKVVLIDPGTDPAPTRAANAAFVPAAVSSPGIYSRAQWGADESLVTCAPSYGTMETAAVHHTASANGYSADAVPGILRGFLAYHTRPEADGGRGWCDIGYNFLVDRFGRVFEGRGGGMDKPVVGVHTGGFNSRTIGVSAIGDYSATAPTGAMVEAISRVIAWKFQFHRIPGNGSAVLTSGGGASKYPEGTVVTFSTVYAHRDAQLTSCPGQALYDQLGAIRARVTDLVNPTLAQSPYGNIETFAGGERRVVVAGWAADLGTSSPISVDVEIDGVRTRTPATAPRPDVGPHGFSVVVPSEPGVKNVCVHALNSGEGSDVILGCREIRVTGTVNRAPIGVIEGLTVSGTKVTVSGWTFDPDTSGPTQAHVYIDGVGVALLADASRPDVAAAYGTGPLHGFSHTRDVAPGEHQVCVFGIDTAGGANTLLGCRSIGVALDRAPVGVIEGVSVSGTQVSVSGWTFDPDTTGPTQAHIYIDGVGAAVLADGPRADVAAVFGAGPASGYAHTRTLAPGDHQVCVYGINTGKGPHTLLGCRSVVVAPDRAPVGVIEGLTLSGTQLSVSGWTFDPDTTGPTQAHIYIDGVGAAVTADGARPDVAAVFGAGPRTGYAHTRTVGPGTHQVCVYGISTGPGPHTLLGCRSITATPDRAPVGVIEGLSVTGGQLSVSGWTFDPDTTAPTQAHVYIDGVGAAVTADGPRPDVAAVFGSGPATGYAHTRPVAPGTHQVCVYGINTGTGPHTLLGCRTLTS